MKRMNNYNWHYFIYLTSEFNRGQSFYNSIFIVFDRSHNLDVVNPVRFSYYVSVASKLDLTVQRWPLPQYMQ